MRTAVLGSGIVGLWTADLLARSGHEVAVISRADWRHSTSAAAVSVLTPFFPGDPESAVFRRGVEWAADTLRHIQALEESRAFLETIPCYEFGLGDMLEAGFPLSKLDHLDFTTFKVLNLDHVVAECDFAVAFECHLCNTSVLLSWLQQSLLRRGVSFQRRDIKSADDLRDNEADVIFNCLGYQSVFPDPDMFPVYGQSMFIPVADNPPPHFGLGAGHHAVFKHRRGFYLGSYFMPGAVTVPQKALYRESLDFVRGPFRELCDSVGIDAPAIDLAAVERLNAGVRPFRSSGPRVELDRLGDKTIVHNYGHGAHGWTIGYASSLAAVRLAGLC